MSRLKKIADRPREHFKEVSFLLRLGLRVDNFHGDAINDLEKFKQWVTHTFTQWDSSILEYFLYEYQLMQNDSDDKYFLDFSIESVLDDDTQQELRPKVEDKFDLEKEKNKKDKE